MQGANSSPEKYPKTPILLVWPLAQQLQIALLVSISCLWLNLGSLGRSQRSFPGAGGAEPALHPQHRPSWG